MKKEWIQASKDDALIALFIISLIAMGAGMAGCQITGGLSLEILVIGWFYWLMLVGGLFVFWPISKYLKITVMKTPIKIKRLR